MGTIIKNGVAITHLKPQEGGGSSVIPNDPSPTTAVLNKLKIDGTNFALAGNSAKVYEDISAMVEALNAMGAEELRVGNNIYISTLETPYLWIKGVEQTSAPYSYISDEDFIVDLTQAAESGLQIGFYTLRELGSAFGSETARQQNEIARQTAEAARVAEEERRVEEYGQFEFDINEALDCIEGRNDIPAWNEDDEGGSTRAFRTGEYCKHDWTDPVSGVTKSYAFRFLSPIAIGDAWVAEKVVQTSVFGELKGMLIGDEEALVIGVSSADGQMPVEGVSMVIFNVTKNTTETKVTGADGTVSVLLDKGDVIDITAANQAGYYSPGTIRHKATLNRAYEYIVYETTPLSCTVIVRLRSDAGYKVGAGASVGLKIGDSATMLATVDTNGNAAFNVPYGGMTGVVTAPKLSGYGTPSPQTVDTRQVSVIVDMIYDFNGIGILMVRDDGEEIPYESWDAADTLIAIHFNTEGLIDRGADFYVKPECLSAAWFVSANNKRWATQKVGFPNVPYDSDTDYDGGSNTMNMISDAASLAIASPAAEFAISQSLTIRGLTASGFIGTKRQMEFILTNKDLVYNMLTLAGFTPAYYDKSIWSSTQANEASAMYCYNNGRWSSGTKDFNNAVVPFFAI